MHNLARTLSKRGICSRKQAIEWIQAGKVRVNGQPVLDPGRKIKDHDKISVEGQNAAAKKKRYLLFHKPAGYVVTRKDEKGRQTIYDLLPQEDGWLFPVGRLDLESEGLLILTNDTAFGNQLTDPKYRVPRTYRVWIAGKLGPDALTKIRDGMEIGRGEKTQAAKVKVLEESDAETQFQITLHEGKNREIRRMFEVLGKEVKRLVRIRFGRFELGSIPAGKFREISVKGQF